MFSRLNILIGARFYTQNGSLYFYEVLDNGRLLLVEESSILASAKQLPVRVIARLDRKIFIDPNPLIAKYSSHMWVLIGFDLLVRSATTETRMYARNIQKTESNIETHDITWKTHNSGKNHDSPRAVEYTI